MDSRDKLCIAVIIFFIAIGALVYVFGSNKNNENIKKVKYIRTVQNNSNNNFDANRNFSQGNENFQSGNDTQRRFEDRNAEMNNQQYSDANRNFSNDRGQNFADSNGEYVNIPVNSPISLSYKKRNEVFDIRKQYVMNSIFARPNYEPSGEVFGQVEDDKPWVGLGNCYQMGNDGRAKWPIDGLSEESRFINNPALLVALEYPYGRFPFAMNTEKPSYCDNPANNLIPEKIRYSKDKKEIEVTINILPYDTAYNTNYSLNGINARDLGYRFVYFDSSKSTFHPDFIAEQNISNQVFEFQNFIHVGGSCGHPGGCNNGSPRQDYLGFRYNRSNNNAYNRTNIPKYMYLKLWKERPYSPEQEADMYEKIIFNYT